ncbi:heme A synthase [Phycicoccus sp. BSK3Z-2]|uniref:Heme A synthase n=1 Tax=Phycicoccus avicenniae TaxID=2828860 RepID=A0A941D5F5_9MICO|nr:COX15/CtaA family protein [Phycicoccus avicenniae]MBR7742225.1 heme A synthase [Phycicoccus avicenniae]
MSVSLLPDEVSTRTLRRWAWANLVANTVIILTGGLVRLTGSGLGCPTWPRCTPESFVPHRELGLHGAVEFGNRLLTYVLVAVVIGTLVAVWRWSRTSRSLRVHTAVIAVGIPFQAVIGGITVLMDLNPWIVALHLVLSLVLVSLSTWLVLRVSDRSRGPVPPRAAPLALVALVLTWVAVYLGTVVTGSGPHAGDADVPRNGLDPELVSRVHAVSVYLLVGVTVALWLLVRRSAARTAVTALLAVELAQGVVGYVQYFTGLPVALVAVHLVGSAAVVAAATWAVLETRPVAPLPVPERAESGAGVPA